MTLFPGGFGTLDEGFEVLTLMQTGKARIIPLVLVDRPGGSHWKTFMGFLHDYLLKAGLVSEDDFKLFSITDDVDAAVAEIMQFYKNFRSYRWVGDRMVIRMKQTLTPAALRDLNSRFADVLAEGVIEQGRALPAEQNEPDILDLPRLILTARRSNFGRLRELIDGVNQAV